MASLPEVSYKGTEYVCVDTPVRIIEQLKCEICLELLSEPVSTSCKHLFCGNCIKDLRKCPKCRTKGFKTSPDFVSTGVIEAFKVKCPNSTEGCEWQGELGDAHEHLRKKCEQQTTCLGCGERMKCRSKLQIHTAVHCSKRPFKCPLCRELGVHEHMTSSIHYTTCGGITLPCPGGCHERIVRVGMKRHLLECPEEFIPCKYAMFGCDKVVKRRKRNVHFSDKDYHFEYLLNSYVAIYMEMGKSLTSSAHIKPDRYLASVPLSFRPWLQNSPTCYPCPPWVIKPLEEFEEGKRNDERWFSEPVYSHFGGYKMCLRVDSNGEGEGKGTQVSVYAYLMKGDNDDNLKFPFKGTIIVSLLNQEEDSNHRSKDLWYPKCIILEKCNGRVTTGKTAESGWGYPQFISHEDLGYNSAKNTAYLKSDSLFFRVDKFEPAL